MPTFIGETLGLYLWASGLILITALLVKYGTEKMRLNGETGRKLLHIIAILTCGYVVRQSEQTNLLAIIFFIFFIILFFVARYELLLANQRRSYGIALFPLAFSILLLTSLEKDAILFGIVTLGISDALAGLSGQKLDVKKHAFLYEDKSWSGFFVFYISTISISIIFIGFTPAILFLALIPALSELFSYRGSDNLTIPLISAFWYQTLHRTEILTIHWYIFFLYDYSPGIGRTKEVAQLGRNSCSPIVGCYNIIFRQYSFSYSHRDIFYSRKHYFRSAQRSKSSFRQKRVSSFCQWMGSRDLYLDI